MYRGVGKVVFKLFSNVKYNQIPEKIEKIKEQRFNVTDVWVDVNGKMLVFRTDKGVFNVNFDDYNKMLDSIITIGKSIFSGGIIDALDDAKYQLMSYVDDSDSAIAGNEVSDLVSAINRMKDNISKGNFELKIYLGLVVIKNLGSFPDKYPEIKDAVEKSLHEYKKICGKEGYYNCYSDDQKAYVIFYAIPEERRIIARVDIEWAENLGKVVKDYHSSEEFLKALDEYMSVINVHEY